MGQKKEIIIPIKGLNHRDIGENIDEGSCAKLHNVSYRNGAWRSVKQFAVKDTVKDSVALNAKYTVMYIHPALPSNEYLASYTNLPYSYNIYHVRLVNGVFEEIKLLAVFSAFSTDSSINIFHYGNMLMMSEEINDTSYSFIYEKGEYVEADYDTIRPIGKMSITYNSVIPVYSPSSMVAPLVATVKTRTQEAGTSTRTFVDTIDKNYENIYDYFSEKSFIHGTANIFMAYKLEDGSIVKVGDIFMINPKNEKCSVAEKIYHKKEGDNNYYYMFLWGYKVTLNFFSENIFPVGALSYVKSIMIYSSPINPIYDFDNVYDEYKNPKYSLKYKNHNSVNYDLKDASMLYDKRNNNVLQRPFYQIVEHDFKKGVNSITIDSKNYENIESKPIYVPTFSQNINSSKALNFNGMLHRYNPKIDFYKGGTPLLRKYTKVISGVNYLRVYEDNRYLKYFFYLKIDGKKHVTMKEEKSFYYIYSGDSNNPYASKYVILPNLFGYPDMRAYRVVIALCENSSVNSKLHILKDVKLTSAPANNFAYFQDCSQKMVVGCYLINRSSVKFSVDPPEKVNELVSLPNTMMVSKKGNPFDFDFKNIYSLGKNYSEIIDVTLPVDDFSEISYGNYPLYLFTTTGIYALQKGSNGSEYGSSILVNTDCIIKSNVVVLNGMIFYITQRGVMCLSGRVSKNISDVLLGDNYSYYHDIFSEYLKDAKLVSLTQYNELLLYNTIEKTNSYAYIFSIEGGAWSTRAFKGNSICGKLFVDGINIYDSNKFEEGSFLTGEIYLNETLYDNFIKKKIEKMTLDFTGNYCLSVSGIDGDIDVVLKNTQNVVKLYRFLRSWNKFRIKSWGLFDNASKIKIIFAEKYCK